MHQSAGCHVQTERQTSGGMSLLPGLESFQPHATSVASDRRSGSAAPASCLVDKSIKLFDFAARVLMATRPLDLM